MSAPSGRGSISRSTARSCSSVERKIADFLGDLWPFCQRVFRLRAATWHGFCIYWKYKGTRSHNVQSAINRDGMPSSRITEINKEEANDTTLVERPAPRRRLSDCGGIATWRLSGCMGAATATAPSAGASPRAARLDRGAGTGDGWSA